jgi:hypothetical protein
MELRGDTRRGAARKLTAAVCVLLVAFGLSLQAIHLHLDAKPGTAKPCSTCLGAHTPLQSSQAAPSISLAAAPVGVIAVSLVRHVPFRPFSLYNRPPPSQA